MASDFRRKDNLDGTVCFESVIQTGAHVGIQQQGTYQTNLNINLMVSITWISLDICQYTIQYINGILMDTIQYINGYCLVYMYVYNYYSNNV